MTKRILLFAIVLTLGIFASACGSVSIHVSFGETPIASDGASALSTPGVRETLSASDGASALSTPSRTPASTARSATGTPLPAPSSAQSSGSDQTILVTALPPEARATLKLIAVRGPFPYRQDGIVFQNREGILPKRANGYYHEYTVTTPGSQDRGTRRIIVGSQGELYYTDDHYVSFKVIVVQ